MSCEEFSLVVEEFYDGELEPLLRQRVSEHIATCPSCGAHAERLMGVDRLLEKSSTPPPASAQLDRRLTEAFRRRHEKAPARPAWWRRLFVGTVSVPKPALAALPLALALAVLAPGIVERRRASSSSEFATPDPGAATTAQAPAPLPPQAAVRTEVVTAPVVRERVVTRVVYVERPGRAAAARVRAGAGRQKKLTGEAGPDRATSGAFGNDAVVTRADLTGFQPVAELKTRILTDR